MGANFYPSLLKLKQAVFLEWGWKFSSYEVQGEKDA